MMAIVASMLVERTERGDEMFLVMLRRHSQHVLDTDALAILPEPGAPEALQPSADDEGAHQPGAEPLWSESWYADFVDEGQGIGGWFRLGLIPNQSTAWVNALLCGPDIPTVAVNDFEVRLPDDPGVVRTDAIELTHNATEPLRTYHVGLRGRGQAYDDPSALLRGEPGRPVDLSMDLIWTTAGTPYQYRLTPRYEIPCTVSGTVVADGAHGCSGRRSRGSATTPGACGTGGAWIGCGARCICATAPICTAWTCGSPEHPRSASATSSRRTARWSSCRRCRHGKRSATTTYRGQPTLALSPGDVTATVEIRGHAPVLLTATDGRREPVPARVGDRDHRGWPHRRRLAGVEPQPT